MMTDKDAAFWNRMAARYEAKPVKDEAAYQRKLDITKKYLNDTTHALEFACGTGTTAILQAPFADHIDAIDFSHEMIEFAREKAALAGTRRVSFHVASIEDWQAPERSYDVIMGHSILHLLRNKEAVLGKVLRLLKPGGVFISNTACIADRLPAFKWIGPIGRILGLLPFLDVFTANQLRACLQDAGFEITEEFHPDKRAALFIVARKPDS